MPARRPNEFTEQYLFHKEASPSNRKVQTSPFTDINFPANARFSIMGEVDRGRLVSNRSPIAPGRTPAMLVSPHAASSHHQQRAPNPEDLIGRAGMNRRSFACALLFAKQEQPIFVGLRGEGLLRRQ